MMKPVIFGAFDGCDIWEVTLRSDAGAEARGDQLGCRGAGFSGAHAKRTAAGRARL